VLTGDSIQRQIAHRLIAAIRGDAVVVEHDFHGNALVVRLLL
jgi:hypothetical protein